MTAPSSFTILTFGGFILFSIAGIAISNNQIYQTTLKLLLTIVLVVKIYEFFSKSKNEKPVMIKSPQKQINFSAFERNQEFIKQPEYRVQQSEMINTQTESVERQVPKERERILSKEQRKNNMKMHFMQDRDNEEWPMQFKNGTYRQYYPDDTRSQYSLAQTQSYQQIQTLGMSTYNSKQQHGTPDYEIQQKSKNSEVILSKLIKKMSDAHQKAEELFMNSFIPTFVREFQDHLVNVNRMMKEHFQQKIIEIDIFFANKPYDINSNKHEKSIGLKSVTMEDVFFLKNKIKSKSREPVKAPANVEKFAKEKAEFIKECDLLELFCNILDVSLINRKIINDKKLFLTKLIDFSEHNCKPKYLSDGLNEKIVSDYELLFTVFINVLLKCIRYEKQKYNKENNELNLNAWKFIEVSLIGLESLGNTESAPHNVASNQNESSNQTQKQTEQIKNLIINQKLEQYVSEPQFHYYSDCIVKALTKDKEIKTFKQEYVLYTPRDQNSLFCLISYYLLHLLNVPKQHWQQLQQMGNGLKNDQMLDQNGQGFFIFSSKCVIQLYKLQFKNIYESKILLRGSIKSCVFIDPQSQSDRMRSQQI
ncbi:unnamed protein product (macronuclear) [Paramecium tetraurelia]|uniref:Transmembrane protein n=1 Tax=Paramecium tetraurelia TaxID=5888 RepID=A0D5Z1_PARTE|nr:uncharacterized protein GSPATT00013888001 [Paramecium tetraurelia]CAK78458.1 unnamed protein product [Paramecium tetraurelia]|eukprot:XP_001445855.1 hypothetical protein (macronuclear) [Paramecium tetraurelia strain d4-2]